MLPAYNNPLARERRLHLVASVLTLVTAGLLSSVGLGLHEWFGCAHQCSVVVAEAAGPSETSGFDSTERCALCDLLSQYRFVDVPTPEAIHGPYLPASLRPELNARIEALATTWPMPRGPPRWQVI